MQLYNSLQPLMVCMSYHATIRNVKSLASGFDSNVLQWSAKLVDSIQVYSLDVFKSVYCDIFACIMQVKIIAPFTNAGTLICYTLMQIT